MCLSEYALPFVQTSNFLGDMKHFARGRYEVFVILAICLVIITLLVVDPPHHETGNSSWSPGKGSRTNDCPRCDICAQPGDSTMDTVSINLSDVASFSLSNRYYG